MHELAWDDLRAMAAHRTELGALLVADALDVVAGLPSESVDLVVTSPPYDRQGKYRDGRAYTRAGLLAYDHDFPSHATGVVIPYGIYDVKGDELRVCGDGVDTATEKNPEARRPKEFDSNKGLLLVFKREKK